MIFVPCKDGMSHNEIEDARPATTVLFVVMVAQAQW
ncbi:N-carbamoyl-L-amino-acid hydrolase [Cupriavidus alkaliphilus]|nr:N-carbamoyl-L-amino-acid hydrolase [Cupriavidus alkaliphilus]